MLDMSKHLSLINDHVCEIGGMKAALDALGIDVAEVLAKAVKSHMKLPPTAKECHTNHRDENSAYKCTKCRYAIFEVAKSLGQLMGLRRHDLTKTCQHCRAIGFEGNVKTILQQSGIRQDLMGALLSDCKPEELVRSGGSLK
jgi:hypothetical protein